MSARSIATCCTFWLAFAVAAGDAHSGGRPPESLQVERKSLDLELDQLHKKTASLGAAIEQRHDHLRRRARALYKISQGGYLRLLLDAESPSDLIARRNGVRRIVSRDLEELSSVASELHELDAERDRLRERERQAAALDEQSIGAVDPGLARKEGLRRPVKGPIVGAFGRRRDAAGLLVTRDGVELATHSGEPAVAVAAGEVRSVAPMPGLGLAIVVDHGGGWLSLVGRLAAPHVAPGAHVAAGDTLAEAAAPSVQLQVSQAGQWLDPTPWLTR